METGSDISCRTPTRPVDVELVLERGRSLPVTLFLSELAETHSGPETMAETLNRNRAFLPARARGEGETCLVRRSAIRMVLVPLEVADRVGVEEGADYVDFVRVELESGESLSGTIKTVLPPDKARLSDYFNYTDSQFLAIAVESGVAYVNRDFISVVWL